MWSNQENAIRCVTAYGLRPLARKAVEAQKKRPAWPAVSREPNHAAPSAAETYCLYYPVHGCLKLEELIGLGVIRHHQRGRSNSHVQQPRLLEEGR